MFKTYAVTLFFLLNSSSWLWAGPTVRLSFQSPNSIHFKGTSTLHDYECTSTVVNGVVEVDTITKSFLSVAVTIPVKNIHADNPSIDENMYEALKADQDSVIQYTLIKTMVLYDSALVNGSFGLRTIGYLSIAGVSRQDTIDVDIQTLHERKFKIIGHKNLSMLDFNIIPPTAFFGLIKAHKNLTVHFDLIAAPKKETISGSILRSQRDR